MSFIGFVPMSSTSSSDCDNCDYCQYGFALDNSYNNYGCKNYGRPVNNNRHNPFYTTMGQPLVYYAQVQQPRNRRQRDRPQKEENCFVKAFKWYTQERAPPKESVPKCGFANWLDDKYIQYLRESRQWQGHQLTAQETEVIEPCRPCPTPFEPCTTKRFARMKSPWRKRRRPCKDSGDKLEKGPNQSCEFILKPKDLTRAASECNPSVTSGCIKSNATLVSSNIPGTLRCSGRSRSLSSVCREKNVPKHIDTIPCTVQEGIKTQPPTKPSCPSCQHREQIQQVPSKSRGADVSCQHPEEKVIPVDAETQYDCMKYVKTTSTEAHPLCCYIVEDGYTPVPVKICSTKLSSPDVFVPVTQSYSLKKRKKVKKSTVQCQCPEENIVTVDTQPQHQNGPELCECRNVAPFREIQEINQAIGPKMIRCQSHSECVVKEVLTVSKFTCVANDAVQTSDHSLCLEKTGATYPFYLKIICADKLN